MLSYHAKAVYCNVYIPQNVCSNSTNPLEDENKQVEQQINFWSPSVNRQSIGPAIH